MLTFPHPGSCHQCSALRDLQVVLRWNLQAAEGAAPPINHISQSHFYFKNIL